MPYLNTKRRRVASVTDRRLRKKSWNTIKLSYRLFEYLIYAIDLGCVLSQGYVGHLQ